jgi:hypothetical protein
LGSPHFCHLALRGFLVAIVKCRDRVWMSFREGQIVHAEGYGTSTFKITHIFGRRKFATIEAFDVSKQKFTGQPIVNVPSNALNRFKAKGDRGYAVSSPGRRW